MVTYNLYGRKFEAEPDKIILSSCKNWDYYIQANGHVLSLGKNELGTEGTHFGTIEYFLMMCEAQALRA